MDDINALHEAIEPVMARLAAGDRTAIWDLHRIAEPHLRTMVRHEARRIGVWLDDDDLAGLALDAAFEVADHTARWEPGGALPWVYAKQRVWALVHRHIGQFTRELDESLLNIEAPPMVVAIDDPRGALRSLARRHEAARVLDEQLTAVSDRDADIYLRFRIEQAGGNRAPAVTVGADHGMRPDAIRKVVQRVQQRAVPVAA